MIKFEQWVQQYPDAARALIVTLSSPESTGSHVLEQSVQQSVRLQVARAGAKAWRNNVGATPARCRHCGTAQTPI